MTTYIRELIDEIDQNLDDLGADLLLIESVAIALQYENEFTQEGIEFALRRMKDYTDQHITDIKNLTGHLIQEAAPSRRAFGAAVEGCR